MTGHPPAPGRYVSAAFRAWTEPENHRTRPNPKRRPVKPITRILVIDTETTTDPTQALTFGCWLHCTVDGSGTITRMEEGIFHADDLADTDPHGFAVLSQHVAGAVPHIDRVRGASRRIRFQTRTEFVNGPFWKLGYLAGAHIVMFNKAFDISRLAIRAGEARGRNYGWFSFQLWENELYRPRIRVKHIDSKKALMSFGVPKRKPDSFRDGETNHGRFLDLRTWAFALTGRAHTLASACDTFGVEHGKHDVSELGAEHGTISDPYVEYARRDVIATAELFAKLYAEHRTHPIELEPTQAFSSASVAKSYLFAMGLVPRLDRDRTRFTPEILARAVESFYGGRAECRIRHTPVPVELHDFTSMYPTVNSLMGLWELMTADRITIRQATTDVRRLLDTATLETMFDPDAWPQLVGLVELAPDSDVLPVRARYGTGESYTIGVNPVTDDHPHWYTIADAVASKILTGKAPTIVRAIRFAPVGKLDTLTTVRLRGAIPINPAETDFFRTVVEQRQAVRAGTKGHPESCGCDGCSLSGFLKVLANSGSYGIFSELNPQDRHPDDPDTVRVFDGRGQVHTRTVPGIERPGHMCFPPIATCITGAARLMLAMLEQCVTELGGVYAFCDTDSLAIVATDDGRLIPCPGGGHTDSDGIECVQSLTYRQCAAIRDRFARLSPYDPTLVPQLLKDECRGTCVAVSAKRYVIYDPDPADGRPRIVAGKFSEHGLGHVRNPKTGGEGADWIREYWLWRVDQLDGRTEPEPEWFSRFTVGSHTVSSPALWRAFDRHNAGKPYRDQIKPFGFVNVGFLSWWESDRPNGRLIAPYDPDPDHWDGIEWLSLAEPDGPRYRLTEPTPNVARPRKNEPTPAPGKTYGELVAHHWGHPEAKFLGPDGSPCNGRTVGLLSRRPTIVAGSKLIGKESNNLDDVQAGVTHDDRVTHYTETSHADADTASRILRSLTDPELVALTHNDRSRFGPIPGRAASRRTVCRWRAGEPVATSTTERLTYVACRIAADELAELDRRERRPDSLRVWLPDPTPTLREWSDRIGSPTLPDCGCGCGLPVPTPRARYASGSCRTRARRNRTRNDQTDQ